jgi:nitrite reductase/ring-hydroxylating ferredoxin subunit
MPDIDTARVVCSLDDLADPGARGFTCGPGDWPLRGFVVRRGPLVRAFVNHCPHAGHALDLRPNSFLTKDGALIICASHGALFEPEQGLCIAGPCSGASLRALPVRIVAGYVLLADDVPLEQPADL